MKNSLNILHYCIYLMHYKLHLLANKINPFILLYKLPAIKKKSEKEGIDLTETINDLYKNNENGLSIVFSGGIILFIIFIILLSLTLILIRILELNIFLKAYFFIFILLALISSRICNYLVFRKNIYLDYFKEYKNWTKKKMKRYIWLSFIFIIGVISFFIVSLLSF